MEGLTKKRCRDGNPTQVSRSSNPIGSSPATVEENLKPDNESIPRIPPFDPNTDEGKVLRSLLPVMKDMGGIANKDEELSDWIQVSESVSRLIKFLARPDMIEHCHMLPGRIESLRAASHKSKFDYSALVKYVEDIHEDAIELRDGAFGPFKAVVRHFTEDLMAEKDSKVATVSLQKYRRQEIENALHRTQEQRAQLVVTLEKTKRQFEELQHRFVQGEQLQKTLQEKLGNLYEEEGEAEKKLGNLYQEEGDAEKMLEATSDKLYNLTFQEYEERRINLMGRAKAVSSLEPGAYPLSLASEFK